MQIDLICIGHKMPNWIDTGFKEYIKRLPANYSLNLIEIPLQKRNKDERMLAAIKKGAYVIALDEGGKMWNSVKLSEELANWMNEYHSVALLIGGPDGLSSDCLQRANQHWSLSKLTLPHTIVRVMVAEQLYRAWSLLNNHPYHRA